MVTVNYYQEKLLEDIILLCTPIAFKEWMRGREHWVDLEDTVDDLYRFAEAVVKRFEEGTEGEG